jgi:glycosyltransferase involved in cell wall biosynthesis
VRIAFYAPIKGPDHPVPSGDRAMARLLMAALRAGGHEVGLVSDLRSFTATSDPVRQAATEASAQRERETIAARWSRDGAPDLWFTYHPFYKAPDFLGPDLVRRFDLAYVTAEASHAPKRAAGPWSRWHGANEAALQMADVHFCLTPDDRDGLAGLDGAARLVDLPPFIDAEPFGHVRTRGPAGDVDLICVAMMRPGDKLMSYAILAEALHRLPGTLPWRLTVIGDGPAVPDVRALFANLPRERLVWRGEISGAGIVAALARADLYVWPGINEAFGMAYLEAGAAGLPTLAMRCGGIPSVVRDGETGCLTPAGDVRAYAGALARLIANRTERLRLGAAARRFVTGERTVAAAAAILSRHLAGIVDRPAWRRA